MILKETSNIIKGFAAIWVIVFHLSQLTNFALKPYLEITGMMHVGLFFFLSGYGLTKSYQKDKNKFVYNFWSRRTLTVLIPFFLINIIYVVVFLISGNLDSLLPDVILKYIFGLKLINGHAWYVVTQLILYVIFYISFKLIPNNKKTRNITLVFLYGIYAIYELTTGGRIFLSSLNFLLGVLFVEYDHKLDSIKKSIVKPMLVFLIFSFSLLYILMLYRANLPGFFHRPLFTINCILLTIILYSSFKYYPILNVKVAKFKLMRRIGVVSYELYLIHYIFIKTMDNQNQILYSVYVLIFSILMAFILHFVFSKLIGKISLIPTYKIS